MLKYLCLTLTIASAFAATPCANLTSLAIPDVAITSAETTPPGKLDVGNSTLVEVPAFCRVHATARPTSDSEIHLEIWLPAESSWNGKFLGTGNGGYSSALSYPAMAKALRDGYATAGNDTGHTGGDLTFGLGHPEKVADFAYRAVHIMTTTAKTVMHEHYARPASEMYFSSCSSGGHQALSEVQRYPNDYDGVIAGAPANNRLNQTFGFLWSWLAQHDSTGAPLLTHDDLRMITQAAIKACDATDGLRDGLIGDPTRCHFDPAVLACPQPNGGCLTPTQIDSVRKVYAGPKNPRTGEQIFAGWSIGSESFGPAGIQSWSMYLLDPPAPMRVEALRYFVFRDPQWDWHTINWDRDVQNAHRQLPILSANETNLSAFARHGGKLILYAGWADPVVPAADTVTYYQKVVKATEGGDMEKTQSFARLFIAPGMGHCGGGLGPNQFDTLTALDQWATQNIPPANLIASHQTDGKVDRTRPLCPYPQVAHYRGTGSIDAAANFTCAK